jgi:hypothetical protein
LLGRIFLNHANNIMKNKFLMLAAIGLASCGNPDGNSDAAKSADTTATKAAVATENFVPATAQVFFRGAGSEPGWSLEIISNTDGTFTVKMDHQDMGKMDWTAQKEALYVDGKRNAESGEVKLSGLNQAGEKATMSLLLNDCTDAAGKKHSHQCVYSSGKTKLSGCGDYVD